MPVSFYETIIPTQHGVKPFNRKAILFTELELGKILDRLRWKEHDAAAKRAEEIQEQILRERTLRMKANWRDTCQAAGERKLAAREARLQRQVQLRIDKLKTMRQDKEDERKQFLEACEKLRMYQKDEVKALHQALYLSDAVLEREAQIEFRKMLQAVEDEEKVIEAARIKKDVADYEREMEEKRKLAVQRRKECQIDILEQLKGVQSQAALEKEATKRMEREDMENMLRELKQGKICERKLLEKRQDFVRQNVNEAIEERKKALVQKELEEKQMEKENAVYSVAKQKIVVLCKKREKEIYEEQMRIRNKIMHQLGCEAKIREDRDNEILRKAIQKKDEKDEKERLAKEAYQRKVVEERMKAHHDFLVAEEKRQQDAKEIKKWQILQRYKAKEGNDAFYESEGRRKIEKMLQRRSDLDKQVEGNKTQQAIEFSEEAKLPLMEKKFWASEDKAFFKYADEVLEDSKQKGRPLFPIHQAIYDYKERNNLVVKKTLQPNLKSSISFGEHEDLSGIPAKDPKSLSKSGRTSRRRSYNQPQSYGATNLCLCGPIVCCCPNATGPTPVRTNMRPERKR